MLKLEDWVKLRHVTLDQLLRSPTISPSIKDSFETFLKHARLEIDVCMGPSMRAVGRGWMCSIRDKLIANSSHMWCVSGQVTINGS